MKSIRIVTATRKSEKEFLASSALGRSLEPWRGVPGWKLHVFTENARPLPVVYNHAIDACAKEPALLLFVHDDVWMTDLHWPLRIAEGLRTFDVIGVAGNRRRVPGQPGWAFVDTALTWDARGNLSGSVAHGKGFPAHVSRYGPSGQPCKLLDGVLLAADSEVLLSKGVRFDERFAFHFYDLDFCRQAEVRGLRMGTWPISLVHESGGAFRSPAWRLSYQAYLDKYGEQEPEPAAKALAQGLER